MNPHHTTKLRGRSTVTTVVIVVVLIALCLVLWMYRNSPPLSRFLGSATATSPAQTGQPQSTVAYSCDQNKVLVAQYYSGPSTVASSGMPMPGGNVVLTLNDGSMTNLAQTVSADGTRYANSDESFVFWSKGNTAFVEQGSDQTQTYTGCIAQSPKVAGEQNWKAFASSALGFSILYPQNYIVDTSYTYQEMGPGKDINGVKFTVPSSMAAGTNLSSNTYVSVEELPNATSCTAGAFLSPAPKISSVTDNSVEYSVASSTGAGAGNRYEEWVYAIPGSSPCTAVRYFIHYGVLDNYPAGTTTVFDHTVLISQFDMIRRTLVLGR